MTSYEDIKCERCKNLAQYKANLLEENREDIKVLQDAVNQWGKVAQIDMVIEECAELILALQKMKRDYGKNTSKDRAILTNVCDEIADVKIMIAQAELVFDKELVQERVNYKMERLKRLLQINTKPINMDYTKIDNVKLEDVDRNDHPDYCDAFIVSADLDGVPMSEEQLNKINEDNEFIQQKVHDHLF